MDDVRVNLYVGMKLQQAVAEEPIFMDLEYHKMEIKHIIDMVDPQRIDHMRWSKEQGEQTMWIEIRTNALISAADTLKKVPPTLLGEFIKHLKVKLVPKMKG